MEQVWKGNPDCTEWEEVLREMGPPSVTHQKAGSQELWGSISWSVWLGGGPESVHIYLQHREREGMDGRGDACKNWRCSGVGSGGQGRAGGGGGEGQESHKATMTCKSLQQMEGGFDLKADVF